MAKGSCLCGGVAFETSEELTPIQPYHATRCRKATDADFSPEILARSEWFQWIQGKALIVKYEAPLLKEPPPYRRVFCKKCGLPLPIQIEGTPFMILNAGILDDDPGTRPFRHAFVSQKACWHEIQMASLNSKIAHLSQKERNFRT